MRNAVCGLTRIQATPVRLMATPLLTGCFKSRNATGKRNATPQGQQCFWKPGIPAPRGSVLAPLWWVVRIHWRTVSQRPRGAVESVLESAWSLNGWDQWVSGVKPTVKARRH